MRKPTQIIGALLRNLAVLAINTANHIDPQPPTQTVWPFTIHTGPLTKTAEARITWHETA